MMSEQQHEREAGLTERTQVPWEAELEQARVIQEDMEHRLATLEAENERLRNRLADEQRARTALEARIERVIAEQAPAAAGEAGTVLREQLSNALEELEVMAEELARARDMLSTPQAA